MLIPSLYNQKGIFERLVHGKNGALLRVRFEVVEFNGELKGRVISVEQVYELEDKSLNCRAQSGNFCLPCGISKKEIDQAIQFVFNKEIVSPYNDLEFFMSQPIRAPSSK